MPLLKWRARFTEFTSLRKSVPTARFFNMQEKYEYLTVVPPFIKISPLYYLHTSAFLVIQPHHSHVTNVNHEQVTRYFLCFFIFPSRCISYKKPNPIYMTEIQIIWKEKTCIFNYFWKKQALRRHEEAYKSAKSTSEEGVKVAEISIRIEEGVAFWIFVARKRKEKKVSKFTSDDWKTNDID